MIGAVANNTFFPRLPPPLLFLIFFTLQGSVVMRNYSKNTESTPCVGNEEKNIVLCMRSIDKKI